MDTITKFAADTRHKEHELDNVQLIAKKILATQTPVLTLDVVYPFVSNDRSSIEFRTPNVLNNFEIKPGFLSTILDQTTINLSKYPIISDYIKNVQPEEGKELITFFLHGQRDNDLHAFIETDLSDHQDKQLYTRIRCYKPDDDLDEREIAKEIGFLINSLTISSIEDESIFVEDDVPDSGSNEDDDEHIKNELLEHADSKQWTIEHERALRTNPIMQAFKKSVRLTTQFPSVKAAKQIMLSVTTTPEIMSLYVKPILGKRQTNVITPTQIIEDKTKWDHILSIVDSFNIDNVESIINTDQVRDFCVLSKFKGTQQDCIKELINTHSPFTSDSKRRYLKRYPNGLEPEIVQQIIMA